MSRPTLLSRVTTRLQAGKAAVHTGLDNSATWRFIRAVVHEVQEDDVFGMAAEMAYRFLFALFPLLLFLVAALGFVGDTIGVQGLFNTFFHQVEILLPAQVTEAVYDVASGLLETRSSAFLTVGLVGTLWGAAGGVNTLMKGLNRAYDVDVFRPFWRRQALALLVTTTAPPLVILLLCLTVAGRWLARWAGDLLGIGSVLVEGLALARWPVLAASLLLGLSLMYHVLPNTRHRYAWSLPGAALASAGWLLVTQGFGLYVRNFGNYDATYGAFGAAMAFMLWLYVVGVVVLLGAEVNALLEPSRRLEWLRSAPRGKEHRGKREGA